MSTPDQAPSVAQPGQFGVPIFDGHNDVLLRLVTQDVDPVLAFVQEGSPRHLDLPKARAGHFMGGLFACFVPPEDGPDAGFRLTEDGYDVPLPSPLPQARAALLTDRMIDCAVCLAQDLPNDVRICRTTEEIRRSQEVNAIALVLHLEGAEAIGPDLGQLDHYYARGVRSIGPVWSRSNDFGCGVPFRYPGTPDIGPGLTTAGVDLVKACHELGVMLDVSHLNMAGFWDLARVTKAPLVATHSNAHAICPVPRNLTDEQLRAIRDTGGLVGISLSVSELRPDGDNNADTPLAVVLQHLDHLLDFLGPEGVAIGSDFDGALMPAAIGSAAGIQTLIIAMRDHGYGDELVGKICSGNWLRVLKQSWRC